MATSSPASAAASPLIGASPARLIVTTRPNTASAKYSGAEKRSATVARSGANNARHTAENTPPMPEEIVAMPIARPACPCCAIG